MLDELSRKQDSWDPQTRHSEATILDKIFGKKVKIKSSKIRIKQKTLISAFALFLTAIAKSSFLEETMDTRLYTHSILRFPIYAAVCSLREY